MENRLLALKWNNHRSTFFHILGVLREKHSYTDATLACEGQFYPVHKLVLSTCSDYFSDIFEKTPCKNPVIVLKDIKRVHIEILLDYMYIGEVEVDQNELTGLIKSAECLQIKGLAVPDEPPPQNSKRGYVDKRPSVVSDKRPAAPPERSFGSKRQRRDSGGSLRSQSPLTRKSSDVISSASNQCVASLSSQKLGQNRIQDSSPSLESSSKSSLDSSIKQNQDTGHSSSLSDISKSHVKDSSVKDVTVPVEEIKSEPVYIVDDESLPPTEEDPPPPSSEPEDDSSLPPVKQEGDEMYEGDDSNLIDKEEHRPDLYDDSLPGPSGVQEASDYSNWGEDTEDYGVNNFLTDDPNQQPSIWSHPGMASALQQESPVSAAPVVCTLCKRQCRTKQALMYHMRTHTGEKPHLCPVCGYRAAIVSSVYRHMRTRHNLDPSTRPHIRLPD